MSNTSQSLPVGEEIFLLKMGEMVLKGLNRRTFEERLMGNARRRLEPYGKFRIYSRQSITYVEPKEAGCDLGPLKPSAACSGRWGSPGPRPVRKPPRPFWKPPRPTSGTI